MPDRIHNIIYQFSQQLAYQNNPKFKKFIADNSLGFKAYASFGKNEITERIAVLVDLVKLVWNDDMLYNPEKGESFHGV